MNKIIEPQLSEIIKEQDNREAVVKQIEMEKKQKLTHYSLLKPKIRLV
jgi:hypothetical protein